MEDFGSGAGGGGGVWYRGGRGIFMTRTIISLENDDKQWLDEESHRSGLPKSAIVRLSIRYMRLDREKSFENLLNQTSGTWKEGDGLAYQERLRSEWE